MMATGTATLESDDCSQQRAGFLTEDGSFNFDTGAPTVDPKKTTRPGFWCFSGQSRRFCCCWLIASY